MPPMHAHLQQVETCYAKQYYAFCQAVFATCRIPSHNHQHHWRVWEYCKRLLEAASEAGRQFSLPTMEALLAASLFHDTGLSRNIGKQHGEESAAIYRAYIQRNPQHRLSLHDEVVEAILHHDDKEGETHPLAYSIASILSTCDDLDAFGYVGIYRYIEIYLMRSVPINQLAESIRANMEKRFATFASQYGGLAPFFSPHMERYQLASSILTSSEFEGIAHTVQQLAVVEQLELADAAQKQDNSNSPFWLGMSRELAAVRYPL